MFKAAVFMTSSGWTSVIMWSDLQFWSSAWINLKVPIIPGLHQSSDQLQKKYMIKERKRYISEWLIANTYYMQTVGLIKHFVCLERKKPSVSFHHLWKAELMLIHVLLWALSHFLFPSRLLSSKLLFFTAADCPKGCRFWMIHGQCCSFFVASCFQLQATTTHLTTQFM